MDMLITTKYQVKIPNLERLTGIFSLCISTPLKNVMNR